MSWSEDRPPVAVRGTRRAAAAAGAALVLALLITGAAFAADPTQSPAGGDPRSPGEGPGLVGDPLLAIGVVLLIGVAAVLASLAYVRFTGGARH